MKCSFKGSVIATSLALALAAPAAQATNGYFKIGYGSKARAMAGVSTAYPRDSLAGVANPANLAFVGNRVDAGVELFNPRRDARLDARGMGGADTGKVDSGATLFAVPHAGFSMQLAGPLTVGLSIAANGGMNTRYNSNLYFNALGPAINASVAALTSGPYSGNANDVAAIRGMASVLASDPYASIQTLGVNLAQVIIAPTVAYKITPHQSIGACLQIGYQRFRAYGLGMFKAFSSDPAHVTNQGDDDAWGSGVRLGWTGQLTDKLTLGVAGATKIYMQRFKKYQGLFAERGDFDVPANYSVGLAYQATPKLKVAADVQRILYSDVKSIGNPGPTAAEFIRGFQAVLTSRTSDHGARLGGPTVAKPLGTDGGWGFGWNDITVVKVGFEYDYDKRWTFMGGINHGGNPIDNKESLFNILAPGVVKTHATVGVTYSPDGAREITVAYMHAFREDVGFDYAAMSQKYRAEAGMDQNALEISYGWKF